MINRFLFAVAVLAASCTASADVAGVYFGAGSWYQGFGGNVIADVSLDDLQVAGESGSHLYVALEHPVPLIPNIRVAWTEIKDSGTGTLQSSFVYAGQTFNTSQVVDTRIDLTHTDVTLYYEIIDVGMDLDLGLTARLVSGDITMDTATEAVDVVVPMAYGHIKVGLPFTGVFVNGEINAMSYSGITVSDYAVALGWETKTAFLPKVGVEGGYRRFGVDASAAEVDVAVDMAVDGFFVNLTAHF